MDAKKFVEIKRKHQLTSQPVVQPSPGSELEAQSQFPKESVAKLPQPLEAVNRTYPNLDSEVQHLDSEAVGYLESLATIEREESIGGSGWGYTQLIKEFRF